MLDSGGTDFKLTLVVPVSEPEPVDIQETLDLYIGHRCRIKILRANEAGRKLTAMKEKYEDLSKLERQRYSYIDKLLTTERHTGLPCGLCFELIPIGSKCVVRKGGNNTKTYHYSCARKVHVI